MPPPAPNLLRAAVALRGAVGRDLRASGGSVIERWCVTVAREGNVVRQSAAARALEGLVRLLQRVARHLVGAALRGREGERLRLPLASLRAATRRAQKHQRAKDARRAAASRMTSFEQFVLARGLRRTWPRCSSSRSLASLRHVRLERQWMKRRRNVGASTPAWLSRRARGTSAECRNAGTRTPPLPGAITPTICWFLR